jgi:glucose/arabinose dehydrogenase
MNMSLKEVAMLKRVLIPLTLALFVGFLLLLLSEQSAYSATTVPTGFSDSTFVSGLSAPTAMAFAPDGRLFVAEQEGKLRVVKDGALLSEPFVDLTDKTDSTGERGLLGVAFDPNFSNNKYVYIYHTLKETSTTATHNSVFRYTASGDQALADSETLILDLDNLHATNHNGGAIHFGRDGKLYVAVGENAVPSNAQDLSNLHGKLLRINNDGTIPTDNPFYSTASDKNRAIWALGLRNPYSFAVRPDNGTIFINDVGQNTWEEINVGVRGANYGWPVYEGPETDPKYTSPRFAYQHGSTSTTGCAITGGAFYNPPVADFPRGYVRDYFFADICSGWISRFDYRPKKKRKNRKDRPARYAGVYSFATGIPAPVDLQVGPDGALYYLARGGGGFVGKIQYG